MLAPGAARPGEPALATVPAMRIPPHKWTWAAICLALAACGATGSSTPGQSRGGISVAAGSYAGVHLGVTTQRLHALLGNRLRTNDNPYYTPAQAPPLLPADNYHDWVYPDVGATFVDGRVASLTVYGLGAATGRGVGIGDPLSTVPRAYPGARCEPRRGGVNPAAPGCQVTAGHGIWVYFSDDPIKLIALSAYPFLS